MNLANMNDVNLDNIKLVSLHQNMFSGKPAFD